MLVFLSDSCNLHHRGCPNFTKEVATNKALWLVIDWAMHVIGRKRVGIFTAHTPSSKHPVIPCIQTWSSGPWNDYKKLTAIINLLFLLIITTPGTNYRLPSLPLRLLSRLAYDRSTYAPVNRKCGFSTKLVATVPSHSKRSLPVPAGRLLFRSGTPLPVRLTQRQNKPHCGPPRMNICGWPRHRE